MSDNAKSWIEERRAIHTTADTGRWYAFDTGVGSSAIRSDEAVFEDMYMMRPDKAAIVDAHNMLPRALDALNAVLGLCDEWDREVSIPGVPGVECDESFKVRLVIQKAIEGAIND